MLLHNPPSLTCLFGGFKIKSWCYANLTVDVTALFVLFVLIFQVGSRSLQYYLVVRRTQIMIKLTSFNILGLSILDLKKGFDKTLKHIPAVSEDLLRIAWKCMKIAMIA